MQSLQESPNQRQDRKQRERELAQIVTAYLNEHPDGMDSLEGIAEWWITRQKIREDVEALAEALRILTEQGVLEQVGSGDSARYRLPKKKS
jgi:hypothetical protein